MKKFITFRKCMPALSLLVLSGLPFQANAYVISDLGGTPTQGWDGAGLGAANINYYVGWSGAPDGNNGLTTASGLSVATIESELANAMATWSSVVDITFTSLGNAVDNPGLAADPWGTALDPTLVLYFHGNDSSNYPFDGPGLSTVFAHAWGPPDIMGGTSYVYAGNIHMDADENWLTGMADETTFASMAGIDLETILLHELGHSLGLGHVGGGFADPAGSVMEPYANIALATLTDDDINGIRQLYSFQGQDWSNGDPGQDPGDGDPVSVPEPGVLFLMSTGILAYIGAGFRRRKNSEAL